MVVTILNLSGTNQASISKPLYLEHLQGVILLAQKKTQHLVIVFSCFLGVKRPCIQVCTLL